MEQSAFGDEQKSLYILQQLILFRLRDKTYTSLKGSKDRLE